MKGNKMEKIIKEVKYYKCGVCGKESSSKSIIEDCEKEHSCDHYNIEYKLDMIEDGARSIELRCSDCGYYYDDKQLYFEHFNKLSSEKVKQIYNILKGL